MRRFVVFLLLFVIFLSINGVYSDMTFIHESVVSVYEPSQVAVIAWNDGVEVLLLGVNLLVAKGIKGIGLMPLPSKPEVYLGSSECFDVIRRFFNMIQSDDLGWSLGFSSIVFNIVLGPHNVTCIKISNDTSFDDIKNILLKIALENGIGGLAITDEHVRLIQYYSRIGYSYFLVDIINAENYTSGFLPPLILKFKSEKVWYPLRISSLYKGTMSIGVLVITTRNFVYEGIKGFWDVIKKKMVSRDLVRKIDSRLLSVFSAFDRYFNIYTFGRYDVYPSYINFDFEGHMVGLNVNIYYYLVLLALSLIPIIGVVSHLLNISMAIRIGIKMKKTLLLLGHVVGIIIVGIMTSGSWIFWPIAKYQGVENVPSMLRVTFILYTYSLIGLIVLSVALIAILVWRLIWYIRTRDDAFITRKYKNYIFIALHLYLLLFVATAILAYSIKEYLFIDEALFLIIFVNIVYLSTLYVMNMAMRRK